MCRAARSLALGATVVLAMALATPASSAPSARGRDDLHATEVGVTGTEIRIAVIADVDTPVAPGLFEGSLDAVRGFARFVNTTGGLAKRKLVVDFIDSKSGTDATRNAVIKACAEDFAMVGTAALFVNNTDDQAACVDQAGTATGLPDIPFLTLGVEQQCSPITFPVSPPTLLCDTKNQHPQTYQASVGRGLYYSKKYGQDLHGIYVFGSDLRSGRDAAFSSGAGQLREVCCTSDRDFDLSVLAPQSAYTPVVRELADRSATYAQSASTFNSTIALRKEARLQGVDTVKVWDCVTQCYDPQLVELGGTDVEDQFVDTLYLPFLSPADRHANKMAATFYRYVGADDVGRLGAPYSWIAAVAFRDALDAVVEKHGVNGLTREHLLAALNHIHEFDADGFLSRIDLAGRRFSSCHVLSRIEHGEFVRVLPEKAGTFACPEGGVVKVKLDLLPG